MLYIDHYLACDQERKRLFLMHVPDRIDVDDGKYPKLNFR